MQTKLRETFATQQKAIVKQQRLLKQIDFLKNEQRFIIDFELRNIENLKQKKRFLMFFDLFIDMTFEQIVFSNHSNNVLIFNFCNFLKKS